jgi:hypothetical protein
MSFVCVGAQHIDSTLVGFCCMEAVCHGHHPHALGHCAYVSSMLVGWRVHSHTCIGCSMPSMLWPPLSPASARGEPSLMGEPQDTRPFGVQAPALRQWPLAAAWMMPSASSACVCVCVCVSVCVCVCQMNSSLRVTQGPEKGRGASFSTLRQIPPLHVHEPQHPSVAHRSTPPRMYRADPGHIACWPRSLR